MKWTSMAGLLALVMALALAAPVADGHEAPPATTGAGAAAGEAAALPKGGRQDARSAPFDGTTALAISQAALGRTVSGHTFTDTQGRRVDIAGFRGKPLIVSLIFTSCYHTCPTITDNLRRAVTTAQINLGTDAFSVVTIGFDTQGDTPERMRAFGRSHGLNLPNWHLLSGDETTIDWLTEELGFIFYPSSRGFDHLSQTTIIDGEGRVVRQVYGESFSMPSIVEPLKDLIYNRGIVDFTTVSGIANRIRLFCTVYDPRDDRYFFDYSIFVGMIISVLILIAMGTVVVRNILRLWREQRA